MRTFRVPKRSTSSPVGAPPNISPTLGSVVIIWANSVLSTSKPNHGITVAGRCPAPKCAAIIGITGGVAVKMSANAGAEDSITKIAAQSFSLVPTARRTTTGPISAILKSSISAEAFPATFLAVRPLLTGCPAPIGSHSPGEKAP